MGHSQDARLGHPPERIDLPVWALRGIVDLRQMPESSYQLEIATLIRTLLGAGLTITNVTTKPHYLVLSAQRFDEFGIPANYLFAYCTSGALSLADCRTLNKLARENHAALVIAGEVAEPQEEGVLVGKAELLGKLGGPITSLLALEPEYEDHVLLLSKNRLPSGLTGKADDLFESYAHAGLQFLLRGRVLRYGQERRFEALPDGLVINSPAPLMLYDCKAAQPPYEITKNAIRQFADYIRDFKRRYGAYLEQPHAFLAISSEFQDIAALRKRANELYADCQVPLVCMTSAQFGKMRKALRGPSLTSHGDRLETSLCATDGRVL